MAAPTGSTGPTQDSTATGGNVRNALTPHRQGCALLFSHGAERMKPMTPAIALLALALAACTADRAPDTTDGAAPADPANAMANDPAAPPPLDQPAEDIPPATAPDNVNQSPDLGLVRMDGYGDMRFGMTLDEARQAWGGELKGMGDEEATCRYLTPQWVEIPSEFAFM